MWYNIPYIGKGDLFLLNILFLILSTIGCAGCFALWSDLSLWWIFPVWIGLYVALTLLWAIFLCIASLFLPKKQLKKPIPFCTFMVGFGLDWLLSLLGIRVRWIGREKLPDEPCVIISNHISDFDPMILLGTMRDRKLVYISKESNFRIPVVGPFIHGAGFLSIDRDNALRAVRTLGAAGEKMKQYGVDVGIYPEGTRSRTGKLLRFKKGAFVLAQKANAPIAILVTRGTEKMFQRILTPGLVQTELEVIEILDSQTVQSMSVEELMLYTRNVIAKAIGQPVEEPKASSSEKE